MLSFYILMPIYFHWVTSEYSINGRIITLAVTEIQNAPFAVIVLLRNNEYFCTGTIINPKFVLTAAHCLFDTNGMFTEDDHSVSILAGTNKLQYSVKDVELGITQIRHSEELILHPQYSWLENFIDDLALIKVKEPFNLTKQVSLVPIFGTKLGHLVAIEDYKDEDGTNDVTNTANDPDSDTRRQCFEYGFGRVMEFTDSEDDYYLKLQQFVVSKNCHCLKKLQSTGSQYNLNRKVHALLCDVMDDYTGLCSGDNGGQLICEGQLIAIGTAVFDVQDLETCHLKTPKDKRSECGDKNSLSIFTDISYYISWMNSHISNFTNT